MDEVKGFVLAGGRSSRMRQDKALMRLHGKPLVLHAAEILQPYVSELAILGPKDRYGDFGLPVLEDRWPGQGPLGAVCTGLLSSSAPWNIFLACDLPRLTPPFVQLLIKRMRSTRSAAVVPRTEDGWQPLCAAYHSRCAVLFERAFLEGKRSISGCLDALDAEAITQDEMKAAGLRDGELANVNTPEDWERFAPRSADGR